MGAKLIAFVFIVKSYKDITNVLIIHKRSVDSEKQSFVIADNFRRDIFQIFTGNCERVLVPEDFLSLDETLYPIRMGVAFRQYNENKVAKYGLLF